jgi:DNA-binding transcriptional LysR family regulator
MLDLVHVRSFVRVIETGSFHAAAKALSLSQPAVSQHVRKLEESLGAALVLRDYAGCRPTVRGQSFFPYARRALDAAQAAVFSVDQRRLSIGASSNIGVYILPPLLRAFERIKDHRYDIHLRIGNNPTVREWLRTGEIDVALLEWWADLSGCDADMWLEDRLVAIMPADHVLAQHSTVSIEDIASEPMIGGETGTGTGTILRRSFGDLIAPRARHELGSTEAVKRAVAAGLGVSIVMRATVTPNVCEGVAVRELEGCDLIKSLWVATHADQPTSAPAKVFRSFILSEAKTICARHANVALIDYE